MKINPVAVDYIATFNKKSFEDVVKQIKGITTQAQKDTVLKYSADISDLKKKLKELQALVQVETGRNNKIKINADVKQATDELNKVTKRLESFVSEAKKQKVIIPIEFGRPSDKDVKKVIKESGLDKGVKTSFDNDKKIDQKILVKVLADTVEFDNKLAVVRAKIKTETGKNNLIKLKLEEKLLKEQLVQAGREFKNLSNNADTSLSRLQAKFNQVTTGITTGARSIVAELNKIGTAFKQQGAGA